jgi:hypothetical protein
MPRLEDLERDIGARWHSTWDNFANFALRDNVLEVAVGLMQDILSCAVRDAIQVC